MLVSDAGDAGDESDDVPPRRRRWHAATVTGRAWAGLRDVAGVFWGHAGPVRGVWLLAGRACVELPIPEMDFEDKLRNLAAE